MKKRFVVEAKKIMADHVALGIENWPEEVGDEIARVHGKCYIPKEDMLICAIDGRPIATLEDVLDRRYLLFSEQLSKCCQMNDEVISSVCSCEGPADKEIGGAYPAENVYEDDDDERLDTLTKIQNYYRFMYPWLFIDKAPVVKKKELRSWPIISPKYHGATRHNHPKSQVVRLHGKANAKKRPCKCRCRKTIRQYDE